MQNLDPTTITIIVSVISLTIAICGVLVATSAAYKNKHDDASEDKLTSAVDMVRLTTQFESLMEVINDVRKTVNKLDEKFDSHAERLITIEKDINTLYRKHDELKYEIETFRQKCDSVRMDCLRKKES